MVDYPVVPVAPGVPPLLRDPSAPQPTPTPLVTSDGISTLGSASAPQWGIFDQGGNPVVLADNVVRLDYRLDYLISDFPMEQGSFQSYDKIINPYVVRLRMSRGGSDGDREEFLASIRAIQGDLNLYSVGMSEESILDVNVMHVEFDRQATSGAGLLSVDIWLQQIRVAPNPTFQNTKSPAGASPVSSGTVQTQNLTPGQQQLIATLGIQ